MVNRYSQERDTRYVELKYWYGDLGKFLYLVVCSYLVIVTVVQDSFATVFRHLVLHALGLVCKARDTVVTLPSLSIWLSRKLVNVLP